MSKLIEDIQGVFLQIQNCLKQIQSLFVRI